MYGEMDVQLHPLLNSALDESLSSPNSGFISYFLDPTYKVHSLCPGLVFARCLVLVTAGTPVNYFHGIPHFLPENYEIFSETRPRPPISTFF
jgi:hypothetical protein